MVTSPGFSSRSTTQTFQQFPQRDEAAMSDLQPGFSNSESADDEAAQAVQGKVVSDNAVEDKAIRPSETKRRTRKQS